MVQYKEHAQIIFSTLFKTILTIMRIGFCKSLSPAKLQGMTLLNLTYQGFCCHYIIQVFTTAK